MDVMIKVTLAAVVLASFTGLTGGDAQAKDCFVDMWHQDADDSLSREENSYAYPWTQVTVAMQKVQPYDVVWVKAGWLYYYPFVVDDEGVTIIGYSGTLNPAAPSSNLDGGAGVPDNYVQASGWINMQPIVDAQNRESGTAITVTADNVEIRNFDIRNAEYGLHEISANLCILENLFVYDIGDNILGGGAGEDGRAIHLYNSDYNLIQNCVVYNSAGYGISSNYGIWNDVVSCRVYCDDNSTGKISATHYYFIFHTGRHNRFVDCDAERYDGPDGAPLHGGHGYVISAYTGSGETAWVNEIVGCTALDIDEPIVFRGQVDNNTIEEFESTLTGLAHASGCITLSNGPEFNEFHSVFLKGSKWAISFYGPTGPNDGVDSNPDSAGEGNEFVNCIFESTNGISLDWHQDKTPNGASLYHVFDNEFFGCTFVGDGSGALFRADRESYDNTLTNCIVTGFDKFEGTNQSGATYDPGFKLNYCCVYDADNANIPGSSWGVGNVEEDPDFRLSSFGADRYQISHSSPCIDAGVADLTYPRNYDYGGVQRLGANYDVGAWEAQ